MSKELRIGIVGTGFGARVHIPVMQATPGVRVVAVASARKSRAAHIAAKFNIPEAFDDYRMLVQLPEVDLVSVVTPPPLHCPVSLEAIEAGKHVLCEKPMAMNAGESRAMLEKARENGVIHLMNFEFRTNPAHKKVKELVDGGYLGRLHQVHVTIITGVWTDFGHFHRNWWFRKDSGGGWLGALGSHFIDLLRFFFGDVSGVSAQLNTLTEKRKVADLEDQQNVSADDTFNLLLKFKNGAVGVFSSSAVIPAPGGPRIVAYGSEGTLVLEGDRLYGATKGETELVPIPVPESKPAVNLDLLDPHYIPFSHWIKLIAESVPQGVQLSPNFEDGLRCQQVMDGARESAAKGKWVNIA
jgi:predicted dehydrogenase